MKPFAAIVTLFFGVALFAQDPFAIVLNTSQGLPSNTVYDMYHDKNGFIWFATGKGLCRYDGKNFENYYSSDLNSSAGSCIQEDQMGRIWYENFDGFLYYVDNGELKKFPQEESVGYKPFAIIDDVLFLVLPNKLVAYDVRDFSKKKTFPLKTSSIKLTCTGRKRFYLVSESEIISFSKNLQKSTLYLSEEQSRKIEGTIPVFEKDKLYFVDKFSERIVLLENQKFTHHPHPLKDYFVQNVKFENGRLWACTTNGLHLLDLQKGNKKSYFRSYNVSSVLKDKNGFYWISTLDAGVLFVKNFNDIHFDLPDRPFSLISDEKEVYIGTQHDKIYKFNPENSNLKDIFSGEDNHYIQLLLKDKNALMAASGRFYAFSQTRKLSSVVAVKSVAAMGNGLYGIATSIGCGVFSLDDSNKLNAWKNHETDFFNLENSVCFNRLRAKSVTYHPRKNVLVFATNAGTQCYNTNRKWEVKLSKGNPFFAKQVVVYGEEILALGADGKIFFIRGNRAFPFAGFNFDYPCDEMSLHQGVLFFFCENGIYTFNGRRLKLVYQKIPGIEIRDATLFRNKLILADQTGLIIRPFEEKKALPPARLMVPYILVNGTKRNINEVKSLKHDENSIRVPFTVIVPVPNQLALVEFKINSSEWNLLDTNAREIDFPSLASGNYTISLKLKDSKEPPVVLSFEIKKVWWKTWWAIGLFVAFITGLGIQIFKQQVRKVELRNLEKLEKLTIERNLSLAKLKAIKSQMNPHFFYNALNTLQSLILSNEKKQAVQYLSKFSQLTRSILTLTEKDFVSLADEIQTLESYLEIEKLRFHEDFSYSIQIDPLLDTDSIRFPSLLLQPYVENSIKHGLLHKNGEKKLSINFVKEDNYLVVTIDDNGIGREKSGDLNKTRRANHNSFATSANTQRIELLNSHEPEKFEIHITDKISPDGQALGTLVTLKMKL